MNLIVYYGDRIHLCTVLEGLSEFESLFRKSRPTKSIKHHSHQVAQCSASRPIRLLEGHRSQAIGILLKTLHVDLDEITQAIVTMETGLVDVTSLKSLNEMVSAGFSTYSLTEMFVV